jgi:hypothetical protein
VETNEEAMRPKSIDLSKIMWEKLVLTVVECYMYNMRLSTFSLSNSAVECYSYMLYNMPWTAGKSDFITRYK